MSRNFVRLSVALFVAAVLIGVAGVAQATLILDLKASSYDPSTGIWTDSSGQGNTATVATTNKPALITSGIGVTPNGSSTVYFDGTNVLSLLNDISANQSFTLFAYLMPTTGSGAVIGGTFNSPATHPEEWSVGANVTQHLIVVYTADLGQSNTPVPTSAFSSINVQTNNSGNSNPFRYNGSNDGSAGGTTNFTGNINSVGGVWHTNNAVWVEQFSGYIAEIRIYNDVAIDRPTVEAEFTASYVIPEPSTLALLATGLASLLCYAWRRRR